MAIIDQAAFATWAEAFNAHDLDGFSELLDDDVVLCGPGGIGGEGKAACIEFYRRWFEDFPDAHLEVHRTHIVDDVAVEEGRFTGTHTGVARTGRPVALNYVQVLRICEGKHVSLNLMFDRLLMLEQLGLIADAERAT